MAQRRQPDRAGDTVRTGGKHGRVVTSLAHAPRRRPPVPRPTKRFERDPAAPICLAGELTYACDLAQVNGRDGACTNAEIGDVFVGPRPTWHCRQAVTAAHTPPLDTPRAHRARVTAAFLLAVIACDALGDQDVGVVAGRDAALVVDAGITPDVSVQIQRLASEVADRPVRYLANTTYHGDHRFGNAAFPPEVIIVSSRAPRICAATG